MHISYSLLIFALLGIFVAAEESSSDSSALENGRVKRVRTEDVDFDNNEAPRRTPQRNRARAPQSNNATISFPAPVVLPPYGQPKTPVTFDKTIHSCLFYLESVTILVLDKKSVGGVQKAYSVKLGSQNDTYGYANDFVKCTPVTDKNTSYTDFSFKLNYIPKGKYEAKKTPTDTDVQFTFEKEFNLDLKFTYNSGFTLTQAIVDGLTVGKGSSGAFVDSDVTASGNATNLVSANIRAYKGYSFGCSATPALLFLSKEKPDTIIGVILNNFQVQAYGIDVNKPGDLPHFGGPVADCIATFNQGTWMGIITTLVLISVLAFAFLMLNSVQTMDRFDDPKQKQIIINFKE